MCLKMGCGVQVLGSRGVPWVEGPNSDRINKKFSGLTMGNVLEVGTFARAAVFMVCSGQIGYSFS